MKINVLNDNGVAVTREMTPEEEREYRNAQPILNAPTQLDRIEAQALYTALITDTLIGEE